MSDDERKELHRLADAKEDAASALRAFGYTNVYGLSPEGLRALNRRGADLEAAYAMASAQYRAFIEAIANPLTPPANKATKP